MRLLLFSDLHCDAEAAEALVEKSSGVDLVIGAGDFANVRTGLDICLKVLKQIDAPAFLVAGNAESTDEVRNAAKAWPSAIVLHGESTMIGGVPVFGLGGAVPVTPFGDWSYDLTEEEASVLLRELPTNAILVAHSPPKGVLDADSRGRSLGSTAIRNAVLAKTPKLVVCGHIHASSGKQSNLGDSIVVNAGPQGVLLELL
jgi:Icc-related predicted phosphoesterase